MIKSENVDQTDPLDRGTFMANDTRWLQRFSNFKKAFSQLNQFLAKAPLSSLEEQGLIKYFEYTYELAWNTLKDFYVQQGERNIQGSRDAIKLAFQRGLIADGQGWMDMVASRIQTTHTYNEKTARLVVDDIRTRYYGLFHNLIQTLEAQSKT